MSPRSRAQRADMVADGVLVALAAARNIVKNVLIVRALRDGTDFDEDAYLDEVTLALEGLAREHEDDAARVAETIARTRRLGGRARHPGDYRSEDRRMLARRRAVTLAVAARLRELARDAPTRRDILTRARDGALLEIQSAAAAYTAPPKLKAAERQQALRGVRDDLRAMLEEREGY